MLQSARTAILQRSKAKQLNAPCEAQSTWCIQEPKRQKKSEGNAGCYSHILT